MPFDYGELPVNPDVLAKNQQPRIIGAAEQLWAYASERFDQVLADVNVRLPFAYKQAGNDDPSVVFDFMRGYVGAHEGTDPAAHQMTVVFLAAALTRLVCAPHIDPNNILAQLDWKENEKP